jgi:probable rRNA maturation factor
MATAKNPDSNLCAHPVQVDVQVAVGVGDVPDVSVIQNWLEQVIAQVADETERTIEVSVKIVDEAEGRALNKQFRDKDGATNVLSFPLADAGLKQLAAEIPLALGDIVICGPVVAREASEQGKDSSDHWAHMLVHGALHLFGYVHETDQEAQEMELLEARILADGGVDNPYEART